MTTKKSEDRQIVTERAPLVDFATNLLELAESGWGVIANVSGGNWNLQSNEWRTFAARWRDEYHTMSANLRASLALDPIRQNVTARALQSRVDRLVGGLNQALAKGVTPDTHEALRAAIHVASAEIAEIGKLFVEHERRRMSATEALGDAVRKGLASGPGPWASAGLDYMTGKPEAPKPALKPEPDVPPVFVTAARELVNSLLEVLAVAPTNREIATGMRDARRRAANTIRQARTMLERYGFSVGETKGEDIADHVHGQQTDDESER